LRSRLEKAFGCALPSTLTFNYPSAAALSKFILDKLTKSSVVPKVPATIAAPVAPPPTVAAGAGNDPSEGELEAMLAASLHSIQN
jgi:hypothetical protein